jgi:DNA polymerase-3 subunit chi
VDDAGVTEVRFYHLQRQRLEEALPALLEKARERGHRIVVRAGSDERVKALDGVLWTYRPETFLAHGSAAIGMAEDQPIWLTAHDERPNGADVLILVDGAAADVTPYALCCELFDGQNDDAVATARTRWTAYKAAGHALTYWQQGERGGWEKRA